MWGDFSVEGVFLGGEFFMGGDFSGGDFLHRAVFIWFWGEFSGYRSDAWFLNKKEQATFTLLHLEHHLALFFQTFVVHHLYILP